MKRGRLNPSCNPSFKDVRYEIEEAFNAVRWSPKFVSVPGVSGLGPTKSVVLVPVVAKPVEPETQSLGFVQIASAAYCQRAV